MSDQLKPCPWCGSTNLTQGILGSRNRTVVCGCGASLTSLMEPGTTVEQHPWNTRALDEASFRAGIEAAAREVEGIKIYYEPGEQFWTQDDMKELANAIRALPTPSTLTQEGGELSKGETE